MTKPPFLVSWLQRWVALVAARPRLTLVALLLLTVAAGFIAVDRYAMNSRLGDLVQQDGGWREDYEAFQTAFPQLVETAIVVVKGVSAERVKEAALGLESAISHEKDLFVDVYAPANETFFEDNAFLYMTLAQLDRVSDQLAQAQPLLSAVAQDPNLRGVLKLVVDGARRTADLKPTDAVLEGYASSVDRLLTSAKAANSGQDARIRWRDEFLGFPSADEQSMHYRLIFLRGQQNYGAALPNEAIVAKLREIIAATYVGQKEPAIDDPDSVEIALTGEIALRHDEVRAATGGVKISGTVALVLLALVLAYGVRSARIVLATFAVLLVGSLWTAAWAMLTVGSFNTLSLVFLVMFFGLGVDFCVHYALRVQEGLREHGSPSSDRNLRSAGASAALTQAVLRSATGSVGGAVLLCTLTTAIGFLGFLPTPYKGLSDLGVISAGGMLVACVLTFTLIPALFSLFGLPRKPSNLLQVGGRLVAFLIAHRRGSFFILFLLVVGCLWLAPKTTFDYSVLALRDPSAESMQMLRELQAENQITDYALYAIVQPDQLQQLVDLQKLDTVEQVISPLNYLPEDEEEKLFALEDLQELLGSSLTLQHADVQSGQPSVEELRQSIYGATAALRESSRENGESEVHNKLLILASELDKIAMAHESLLLSWQDDVAGTLVQEIAWLAKATKSSSLDAQDLPVRLRERLITEDGRYLAAILPANDITPVAELNRFIDSVRQEYPSATGRPVVEWGVGNIVLGSFKTALVVALAGISLVLLIALRSLRDTLLVLTPLLLTALFTLATSVLLEVPLNMASVLVLPLIFGLGVDNGIHTVERFRTERLTNDADSVSAYMLSSTPRAVLLSTLTTIGTFAALMLSPHAGTASIGFLLTTAIGYLLLFTVFLLPLLLSLTAGRAGVTTS